MMTAARSDIRASIAAVVLIAHACAQPPDSDAAQDDRTISVGRWNVIAVESNGKSVDPELIAMLSVDYRADGSWRVLFKSLTVAEGRSTNRQNESPKTFETETLGSESMKPVRYTGIYKSESDTRVLCFVPDGMPRPDEFLSPRGSGRVLVTLRRPADTASPCAPPKKRSTGPSPATPGNGPSGPARELRETRSRRCPTDSAEEAK